MIKFLDYYAYGIVNIDDCLDANDLVGIMNDTLSKNEQMKISNKIENSTQSTQQNFADIEDDFDNISEIEEEECVDFSKLFVIKITSLAKSKENDDSKSKQNNDSSSTTKTDDSQESVIVEDITNNGSDNDDDSCEKEIPQVVEAQFYIQKGNGDKVDPNLNELLKEDNSKVTDKGKGKKFQLKEYYQEQVKQAFENYLNESMSGSTTSQESFSKTLKWQEIKTNKKVSFSKRKVEKENIEVEASTLNDYIYIPKSGEVICNEQCDKTWYIDSGCSRHMTVQKENLRDFRKLENVGLVKFGNNQKCKVKGYRKVTNRKFIMNRVTYIEGLKYNLISVSQLVVGTGNEVLFDKEGSMISNKETKEVVLKSKRKGDMFILDIKPIVSIPSICLLLKASSDLSWLWHRRLSHLNFKILNKLILNDLLRGLPVLKLDNDSLYAACEQGKQH
ncbi:hypothetical protein Lser_V15G45873 [Lactuca serriola]